MPDPAAVTVPDMSSENRQLPHWTTVFSAIQVLMTAFLIYIFYKWVNVEEAREEKWFYFAVVNGLTVSTIVSNIIFSKENFIRHVIASTSLIMFTFVLPLTLSMIGLKPSYCLLSGMIFTTLIICVCPFYISILAFATGAVFSLQFPAMAGVAMDSIYQSLLAYFGMTTVAMIWRSLFVRLIMGYVHLSTKDPGDEIRTQRKIEELENEKEMLRNEVITHITELNQAVLSHQPEQQEGQ